MVASGRVCGADAFGHVSHHAATHLVLRIEARQFVEYAGRAIDIPTPQPHKAQGLEAGKGKGTGLEK